MTDYEEKGINERAEDKAYDLSKIEPYYIDDEGNEIKSEDDLSMKARKAANAFYDLVASTAKKTKEVAVQKTKEIASSGTDATAVSTKDARDISSLGSMAEELARHFEGTITEIRKQTYSDQADLLIGYKKLLEEQVRVIDARLHYVQRL
jgi:hypothetical protein